MTGRQSPDTASARRLIDHALAVADDPRMPESVLRGVREVIQQANDEIREELRGNECA